MEPRALFDFVFPEFADDIDTRWHKMGFRMDGELQSPRVVSTDRYPGPTTGLFPPRTDLVLLGC